LTAPSPAPFHLEPIRSASNALVKRVRAAAAGRTPGTILLEGERLLDEARRQALELELVLVTEGRAELADNLARAGLAVRTVANELFERLGSLRTPPGVLALAPAPGLHELAEIARGEVLVCVAADVQDPGNLGALARTAEAAGAAALIVCGAGCRPWSPKALRGSMGSLLRLPLVIAAEAAPLAEELAARGFRQVTARTRAGHDYESFDWNGPLALWLLGETGRADPALARLEGVSIPMAGHVESLNVTAAAAILLFAAKQKREQA